MVKTSQAPTRRKAHYYWWTLVNASAACFAILSWLLCLHVFGHPEIPRNYKFLEKLGRISDPVGFPLEQAPVGDAADPRTLYRRYSTVKLPALDKLNAALMRNYLTGVPETNLIQYVEGDFQILEIRELTPDDFFSPGFAVRAQAMVQPDEFTEAAPWPVEIQYLFPTHQTGSSDSFRPGDLLSVKKVPNCAMVLHISRIDGEDTPIVTITAVPLAMGEYQVGDDRKVSVKAPRALDPKRALTGFLA